MAFTRVRKYGHFYDVGPAVVPPQARGIAMYDRATGTIYHLSHTGGGSPSISLAALPSRWRYPIYGPYAGPYMNTDAGQIRLYVSGGTLSHEAVAAGSAKVENSRVYATLTNFSLDVWQVDTAPGFEIGDPLTLTKVST